MKKSKVILVVGFVSAFLLGLILGSSITAQRVGILEGQLAQRDAQMEVLQGWLRGNITYYEAQISTLRQQLEVEVLGVYFSPKGGCAQQVINWINRANKTIHILIYSFTLDSIGDALINAHRRGVDVKIVFEKSQISMYSEYRTLRSAGIMVRNDTNPSYMHNKVMIIDGLIVFTGSFNWSASAEGENNENLIIIRSTYVASIYEKEFEKIWNQAT